ncbi:MAG: MarR family transcriptional regulator [Saprospiraceae bacterium]|nr:MarR family transcriptional regulator [Saprospiraceae bacterium]
MQNTEIRSEWNTVSGYKIEVASKLMRQTFKRMLRERNSGITIDQWVLLQQLGEKDGISQWELANAVYKDAPTVTRIIDLLVEAGLVLRATDQDDRRKFLIRLTQAGKKKIREVEPLVQEFRSLLFNGMNKKQLKDFQVALDLMLKNLQ